MDQPILFIINPAAGKDEPVEEMIGRVFQDSGLQLLVHVLAKDESPATVIKDQGAEARLIAVYGGDGSVTEAAAALIGKDIPMAIIPGGTANVLSKELGIPQDTEEALILVRDHKYKLQKIDTGRVNGRPFLLRVNLGVMAEMITETDPDLKEKIGQLAYGVATVKSLHDAQAVNYQLTIDDQQMEVAAVALTVTNSGSAGIGDLQMQPGISMSDGLLDVLLLRDAGFLSVVKAAGGSILGKETDAVSHWKGKSVSVKMAGEQTYLCDDYEDRAKELRIQIVPSSLTVAVPC